MAYGKLDQGEKILYPVICCMAQAGTIQTRIQEAVSINYEHRVEMKLTCNFNAANKHDKFVKYFGYNLNI